MIFVRVKIENFFSISSPITWEMENQGLVLIVGENRDSQAACSNGSGKSALIEAIVWALWGKTARGQSNDGVVNRKVKKNCKVELWLRHNGDLYCITRYRKHDTEGNGLRFTHSHAKHDLTQGTVTLTQDKINAFLGIDYDTFIQGPMTPQGHFKKFSEMTDGEQKAIFDRALQTGVLAEALKETNDRVAIVSQRLTQSTASFDATSQNISAIKITISQYEAERDNWSKEKRIAICGIAKEIAAVVVRQEQLWEYSLAVNFDQAIAAAKASVSRLQEDRKALQLAWVPIKTELSAKIAEIKVDWRGATAQVKLIHNEIKNIENLKEAICPTCRQVVTHEYTSDCLAKAKEQLTAQMILVTKISKEISAIESELATKEDAYNSAHNDLSSQIDDQEAAYLKLIKEASEARAWVDELATLQRQEATLRSLFKKKQAETTPFNGLIAEAEKEVVSTKKALAKTRAAIRKAQIDLEHLQFWQYGFSNRGLKSHILASVTPFLNDRAKRYIKALAGDEINIRFDTQTMLKSGEMREKFSVLVTNKNGADTYAGNSGGEKSRADLAVNFVLADLMALRSRCPYPQRFFDEPFENLDESGTEAVVELLSDLAADAGSIFVVTHLDSMKGLFAKTLKLVKKNGTTSLVTT